MKTAKTEKARIFAAIAHESIGQKRKYTNEPYINHPINVANIINNICPFATEDMLCASYLHDVLEDVYPLNSLFSATWIEKEFGEGAHEMVVALTEFPCGAKRAERKSKEVERLSKCDACIRAIKIADMIDNASTITIYDKEFAKVYLKEKKALLDAFSKNPHLMIFKLLELGYETLTLANSLINHVNKY